MLTVGQITDKISEIRSKIAVYEGTVLHLKANYKSTDAGPAEMHFTRSDGAIVPEEHIDRFIDDTVFVVDGLRAELSQWENLSVPAPGEKVAIPPSPAQPVRKAKKKVTRGATRRGEDQPAPRNNGPAKGG
jgi:hypothetical protein